MAFYDYFSQLSQGLGLTIMLMICALALGIVFAFLMTCAILSHRNYLKKPVTVFIFFIRGTPVLVQLFLIYFGLGQFDWIRHSVAWIILQQPFSCAVLALALNTSAYTTVLFKGAIRSVPKGEFIACEALGMSYGLMMKRIIFPRAIRIALPAYSNEVVMILKATSLASTVTLLDLMGVTNQIIAQTYQTIPLLCLAGVIYLAINGLVIGLFRWIEHRSKTI